MRAAEARLAGDGVEFSRGGVRKSGDENTDTDEAGDMENVDRVITDTKEPGFDPQNLRPGRDRRVRSNPRLSPKKTGNHFWFGCGKLKKKVESIRAKTMRLRAEISSRSIKDVIVPHPDKWIKANMSKATIEPVTDEHAYWHGCAKCAWELTQHMRIHGEAKAVLAADDRKVKQRRDDSLYLV
jgi:hypothetical protein